MGGRRASSASRLKLEKSELGGARDEWPVRELRLRTFEDRPQPQPQDGACLRWAALVT